MSVKGSKKNMILRIHSSMGNVLATLAGILFLKYADTQSPFALPSHLYQEGNDQLGYGLPWWVMSGAVVGLVIALSLLRYERQLQQGFVNITIAIALVAFILSYFVFAGYTITLPDYLLVSVINVILLSIIASLPAGAALIIVSMLFSRPAKRSGLDIMPDELKAERLRRASQQKHPSLLMWLQRDSPPESK
jgi:hypothetical protein